jgi:hypothetical protein
MFIMRLASHRAERPLMKYPSLLSNLLLVMRRWAHAQATRPLSRRQRHWALLREQASQRQPARH